MAVDDTSASLPKPGVTWFVSSLCCEFFKEGQVLFILLVIPVHCRVEAHS